MWIKTSLLAAFAILILGTPATAQHAGDYNGDGYQDLAFGLAGENVGAFVDAGIVHVIYGTASGLSAAGNQVWSQNSNGIADSSESFDSLSEGVSGDFNNDGYDDLVLAVPEEDGGGFVDAGAIHVLYGSSIGLRSAGSQFWTQDTPGVLDAAESGDFFGASLAAGDFNNDGFDDLAIGAPSEGYLTIFDAGGVHVLYGPASGLQTLNSQFWTQNSSGIADSVENSDAFGESLASGDFNGDGFDDLAIGAPGETLGILNETGVVHVLYGSNIGLRSTNSQFWHQNVAGVVGTSASFDAFGNSLCAGDFNNDGFGDLAISVLGKNVGTALNAGAVVVLYGSASGLVATGNQQWTRNSGGIPGLSTTNDLFGESIECGDFDGDGFDDLAIGVALANVGTQVDAGVVHIIYGTVLGLRSTGTQMWSQNSSGINDLSESGDGFGAALFVGDFDGDDRADLAIGVASEDFIAVSNVGVMAVIYGSNTGLASARNQVWHQNSPGILESLEASDAEGL